MRGIKILSPYQQFQKKYGELCYYGIFLVFVGVTMFVFTVSKVELNGDSIFKTLVK